MNHISAIFFDVGNILIPVDWSRTMDHWSIPHSKRDSLKHEIGNSEEHDLFEKGMIALEDWQDYLNKQLSSLNLEVLGIEELEFGWQQCLCPWFDRLESILPDLSRQYDCYSLSNTNQWHAHIFEDRIFEGFKGHFLSHEMNQRKPDEQIYLRALEVSGLQPSSVLYLDDLPENIETARKLGLRAVHCPDGEASVLRALQDTLPDSFAL